MASRLTKEEDWVPDELALSKAEDLRRGGGDNDADEGTASDHDRSGDQLREHGVVSSLGVPHLKISLQSRLRSPSGSGLPSRTAQWYRHPRTTGWR